MSDHYHMLLEAVIEDLSERKARGETWIQVNPDLLNSLAQPARRAPRAPRAIAPAASPPPASIPERAPVLPDPDAPAPAPALAPSVLLEMPGAPVEKLAAINALRERVLACVKCPHLAASRKSVVFGVGDIHSPLMFVGEAPGADEDVQGEPFVGAAGQLLTRIIKAMGFSRETVYIANVLKCRPDTPGQAYGNRKPNTEEMKTCLPYLLDQIKAIQPKVIVALGGTAMEGLFGRAVGITRARGHWQSLGGTDVMPTYHPSYLLRNQAPAVKREVWEDMLQVLERLALPISEKQRNYFKA